jgi:hypothetical protein
VPDDRGGHPNRQVGKERYSQGAMFNVKPTAQHRWPRGYTPERQAAVSSALSGTETHVSHSSRGPSPYLSSTKFFTPGPELSGGVRTGKWSREIEGPGGVHEVQAQQAQRVHTDILARSTVPVEHMQNLPAIHVQSISGAAGTYEHPGRQTTRHSMGQAVPDPVSEQRGRITINPHENRSGATLVHEIGHHIDYQADPWRFKERSTERAYTEGFAASPALEGYAEGYSQGHTVPRRGESTPNLSYRGFIPHQEFQDRYKKASGGALPQEHPSLQKPPAERWNPHYQPTLYGRNAEHKETSAPGYRDYGQHELRSHVGEGASLGTIKVQGRRYAR